MDNEFKEEIKALRVELEKLNEGLSKRCVEKRIFSNADMLELLQIKTSTLRRYRDEGYLGFSKVGDKYFYTAEDVSRFLERSHNEPFAL